MVLQSHTTHHKVGGETKTTLETWELQGKELPMFVVYETMDSDTDPTPVVVGKTFSLEEALKMYTWAIVHVYVPESEENKYPPRG